MSRAYSRPKPYDEDGWKIYYTNNNTSARKKTVTRVKMTFREPKKTYISSKEPEYGRILYFETHEVPDDIKESSDPIRATVARFARTFYCGVLNHLKSDKDHLDLLKNIPFGVACEVWFEDNFRATETLDEYKTAYETMRNDASMCQWFSLPVTKITAATCNIALGKQPVPTHRKMVALIRSVWMQEIQSLRVVDDEGIVITENPWDTIRVRRPTPNRNSIRNIHKYVRSKSLEPCQTRAIISDCLARLESKRKRGGNKIIALLSLFVVCMGVVLEELLYLRVCDIIPRSATNPPCIVVLGRVSRKSNGRNIPYGKEDVHRRRILPIPDVVETALKLAGVMPQNGGENYFQNFESAACENEGEREAKDFLFPKTKNKSQHLEYSAAKENINKMFAKICKDKRLLDGSGNPLKNSSAFAPYFRMIATAGKALRQTAMEDDELRYFWGKVPDTVAAEHYCDFSHENELYRLHAFLNCSLRDEARTGIAEDEETSTALKISVPGEVLSADFSVVFPALNEEQMRPFGDQTVLPWLRIAAEYGFNISAQFRKGETNER